MTEIDQRTAELQLEKAQHETAEARHKAAKAESEAKAARATVDVDADPNVAAALRSARLSELAKQKAEADAVAEKAGVPEVPTFPEIKEPTDKSPTVGDDAGSGTANLTAATALDRAALDIGMRVVLAITGERLPEQRPKQDPRIEYYSSDEAASGGSTQSSEKDRQRAAAERRRAAAPLVHIIDSPSLAEATLTGLEIQQRLAAFCRFFAAGMPDPGASPAQREDVGDGAPDVPDRPVVTAMVSSLVLSTGVTAAAGLAKFGVELVGALRSRYALHGRTVALDRTALVSAVIDRLLEGAVAVRWPRFEQVAASPLIEVLARATLKREEFAAAHRPALQAAAGGQGQPDPVDESTARAAELVKAFDAYVKAITEPGDDETSVLVEAALAEAALPRPADTGRSYLLFLGITGQGADAMTGQGLLKGTSAAFLGYAQAFFVLTRPDGAIVTAGTSIMHREGTLNLQNATFQVRST